MILPKYLSKVIHIYDYNHIRMRDILTILGPCYNPPNFFNSYQTFRHILYGKMLKPQLQKTGILFQ